MSISINSHPPLKGAIFELKPPGSPRWVIVLQYNPNTLTRTLTARMMGSEASKDKMVKRDIGIRLTQLKLKKQIVKECYK